MDDCEALDRIPVSQILQEYEGVGKSKFYADYLKDLRIKPTRIGQHSYVTSEEKLLLDKYHSLVPSGKPALKEFLKDIVGNQSTEAESLNTGSLRSELSKTGQNGEPNSLDSKASILNTLAQEGQALVSQAGLMLDAIAYYLTTAADQFVVGDQDPFATHRWLELAAKKGWLLPTSKLLPLLGLKSIPRLSDRKFARLGFLFERIPRRPHAHGEIPTTGGIEAEWKVSLLKDKEKSDVLSR